MKVVPTKLWDNVVMATGGGGTYTANINSLRSSGFASIFVQTSAGSLELTFQVSDNGSTWYTPEDTNGNSLGVIVAAMTVGSKWIVFDPQIARYARIKAVITVADSTVLATYRQLEEI